MENLTYILNRDVIRITKIGMLEVGGTDGDLLVDGFPDYLKSGSNIKVFDEMNQESHIMLHNDAGIKALTFCVQSETDEDIVMTTRSNFTYKLWVNGSLAGYVGTATDPLVITKARKGVNIFMLEIDGVYIDGFVALRLSRYAYETQMQYDRLIWGNLSLFSKKAVLLTAKGQISEASILKYLLVANDSVSLSLDQKAQLKIFTKIGMKLIYDSECVFNQADGIDLSSLIQAAEGECIIYMQCVYTDMHGEELFADTHICLAPVDEAGESIMREASDYIGRDASTEYEKYAAEYMIKNYRTKKNTAFLWEMCGFLRVVKSGAHYDGTIYKSGGTAKYYKSKLTDMTGKYGVALPEGYDREKAYPLLIVIEAFYEDLTTKIYARYPYEDIVTVVVSSQGFTLGSYVGEAAIWDALADVAGTYSIDENRIYITGASNGGAATWALAKAYPDKFAGIYVVSGNISHENIENIKNIKIFNISSKSEGMYDAVYGNALEGLNKCKHFVGVLADNMNHGDLMFLRFNRELLRELLGCRLDRYPAEIYYRSDNYRNLAAYWVSIHSIEHGKAHALVQANAIGGMIHIEAENLTGLTVALPPHINRDHFEIYLNKKHTFVFDGYGRDFVRITKRNGGYFLAENEPKRQLTRKGRGLIDVYLDPVIVCCNKTDKRAVEVAANLSKPVSYGIDPVINVEYPIMDTSDTIDFEKSSVIVIDSGEKSGQMDNVRDLCKIKTHDWGYEYNGNEYKCEYCIMQIMANPENGAYSILHVKSNNPGLYRKNLFTRRMILPSYSSGYHPCLNNEALIYTNGKHYRIYEWGMEIEAAEGGAKKETTPAMRKFHEEGIFLYKGEPTVADRLSGEVRYSFSPGEMKFGSDWVIQKDHDKLTNSSEHRLAFIKPEVVNPMQPYSIAAKIKGANLTGISVCAFENGNAYSYLFTDNIEQGYGLNFLHDVIAWSSWPMIHGKAYEYEWKNDEWYWMKLECDNEENELRGKIWKADETEPGGWMHTVSLMKMNMDKSYGIRYGQPGIRYLPKLKVEEIIISAKGSPPVQTAPKPKIIQTKYETEDIVIADVDIDDIQIGDEKADKTGIEDATAFIRAAISLCASAGGGTVWLSEGKYRITDGIVVKPYVTLRGENNCGTVVVADVEAQKNGEQTELIGLSENAGYIDLTVRHKKQIPSNDVCHIERSIFTHKPAKPELFDASAPPYSAESVKQIWDYEAHIAGIGLGIPADATGVIQQALDDAGKNGGGVVYLPAGIYRIDGSLTVPAGVEFRGCSPIPTGINFRRNQGTILVARGESESARVLVAMEGDGAGLRNLGIVYKKQPSNICPCAVRGNGKNIYVMETAITNVHTGIDLLTHRCFGYYIRGVVSEEVQKLTDADENNGSIEACVSKRRIDATDSYYAECWLYED